jgi:hypothetical protein
VLLLIMTAQASSENIPPSGIRGASEACMPNEDRDFRDESSTVPASERKRNNVVPIRSDTRPRGHDPGIDYEPPNPAFVLKPANFTIKLFAAVVSIILFALVMLLMFHNWMVPGPRQPGGQKSNPGLQQRVP